MPAGRLAIALNAFLPDDIALLSACALPAAFPRALRRDGQAVSFTSSGIYASMIRCCKTARGIFR